MLTIRRATEADATVIALLGRITFSEAHEHIVDDKIEFQAYLNKAFDVKKIETELKEKTNFFWIAFHNKFPVAYSKLVINSSTTLLNAENVCRLERIYVLKDFFHLKIGGQLQELIFKKALELHFHWIWLTVSVENYRAINFYIKNNYKDLGIIDFSIGNKTYDNTVFAKQLVE